ncbi:DUF3047 domain-containing protein [Candidatus Omnitrophota bacterium]
MTSEIRRHKILTLVVLISLAGLLAASTGLALRLPWLFSFNKANALLRWKERVFKGKVLYMVNLQEQDGYLSAYSQQTASGIFYRMVFNPRTKPMASWKWKVLQFPDKAQLNEGGQGWIEKDDYAARFYVIFPGIMFKGTRCLEYVWDKDLPEGLILTSPYFKNIKIFVVESGTKNLGKWVFEERDIRADYKKAFGREPSKVGAVAIMTDSDNTVSSAEAWYDELKVGYEKQEE